MYKWQHGNDPDDHLNEGGTSIFFVYSVAVVVLLYRLRDMFPVFSQSLGKVQHGSVISTVGLRPKSGTLVCSR